MNDLKDMDEFDEDPYEILDRMKLEKSKLSFESMILLSFFFSESVWIILRYVFGFVVSVM